MDIVPLLAPYSVDADPGSSTSRQVSSLPPVLGGRLSSDPSNGFLERATWFLIHSARGGGYRPDKHRVTAYMSLAELGDAIGGALWSKPSLWSAILRVIREGIPTKGELPSDGVLACMEMAVRVTASQYHVSVGDKALVGVSTSTAFENDLRGLVMLLVSHVELSEALVNTVTKVIKAFPALSSGLREGLMLQLSRILRPLDQNEEGGESHPSPTSPPDNHPVSSTPITPQGSPLHPIHDSDSIEGSKLPQHRTSWLRGIITPYSSSPQSSDRATTTKSVPDSAAPDGQVKEKAIVLALGVLGSFDFYSSSAEEIVAEDDMSSLEGASMDRPASIDHPRITIPRMFYLGFDLIHVTCTSILHAEVLCCSAPNFNFTTQPMKVLTHLFITISQDKHHSPSVRVAWGNAACKLMQRYLAFIGIGSSGYVRKACLQRYDPPTSHRSLYEGVASSGGEMDTVTDITENDHPQ